MVRHYCSIHSVSIFFEELSATSPATRSVTGQRCVSLLEYSVFPDIQAMGWVSSTMFMQYGAPSQFAHCLNRCSSAIWLVGYLKVLVYRATITQVSDLKDSITCYVRTIHQNTHLSTVEHAILLFQVVADNGRHYTEEVLKTGEC